MQFPVGFYLVALVFIVFDALAVFLFPWALALRAWAWGLGSMVVFVAHHLARLALRVPGRMLEWK